MHPSAHRSIIYKLPRDSSSLSVHQQIYRHTMEYYSVVKKKNKNFSIRNNMDGLGWHLPKGNKSYRERQIVHGITYM